jgi:hypothetical protein
MSRDYRSVSWWFEGAEAVAGRTLADLITGANTELTALPWVNHRSPAWEPEPLRWFGITTRLRLIQLTDRLGA